MLCAVIQCKLMKWRNLIHYTTTTCGPHPLLSHPILSSHRIRSHPMSYCPIPCYATLRYTKTHCTAVLRTTYPLLRPPLRPQPAYKKGLEYGVRAPVFYGNLREQTGENGFPRIRIVQEAWFVLTVLTDISESLRKPRGVFGKM